MKQSVNYFNNIFESKYTPDSNQFTEIEFANLQSSLSATLNNFSYNQTTKKLLFEVNDILLYADHGTKRDFVVNNLTEIPDATVQESIDVLTENILNLSPTKDEMTELFDLWKKDELIDVDLLMSTGKNKFSSIFKSYDSNNLIRQLVNNLAKVTRISNGKGEFLLSVFSHQIYKRSSGGDLIIKDKNIELKTTDGGSARFSDQKVKPLPAYFSEVSKFRNRWSNYLNQLNIPTTGLSVSWIYKVSQTIPEHELDEYFDDITSILKQLFPNQKVDQVSLQIRKGDLDLAKLLYAVMNIYYYKSVKDDDDGILYLNIANNPCYSAYFETYQDLSNNKLNIHTNTFYPIVFNTDSRDCYPQITIK